MVSRFSRAASWRILKIFKSSESRNFKTLYSRALSKIFKIFEELEQDLQELCAGDSGFSRA